MGADLRSWLRQLRTAGFRVDWSRIPLAAWITLHCACCSLLGLLQRFVLGRRIAATPLHPEPVFILGHWRSGTTMLHQLLTLDPRHVAPSAWECFAPHVSALLGSWFPRVFFALVPRERPQDGQPFQWDEPQEEEFALCNLGQPSPYSIFAFPTSRRTAAALRATLELSPRQQAEWEAGWTQFLRQTAWRRPGRLILKSPPHSCRIEAILMVFPQARFVHLVRDPVEVFRSTERLWQTVCELQSVQRPQNEDLTDFVMESIDYVNMRLEHDARRVAPERWITIRFEDLMAAPMAQIQNLYEQWGLGNFEEMRPRIVEYLAVQKRTHKNNYRELTPQERGRLVSHWSTFRSRHRYESAGTD